jgi:hypothetical protein
MRTALRLAAASGLLIPIRGGYWVSGSTSQFAQDALSLGRTEGRPEYVGTRTVYACDARGYFERCANDGRLHKDARKLTEAGRAALESVQP